MTNPTTVDSSTRSSTLLRALSITQPWAGAIAWLGKDVENRTWGTDYRGSLLIHASAGREPTAQRLASTLTVAYLAAGPGGESAAGRKLTAVNAAAQPTGRHLALAELVDVCRAGLTGQACKCGRWAEPGRVHWRLANVQPLTPQIPARGRLGLWTPDTATVAALAAQGVRLGDRS